MKRRKPGLTLFILGLISIILCLALAGCAESASGTPDLPTASRPETTTNPTREATIVPATSPKPGLTPGVTAQPDRGQGSNGNVSPGPSQPGTAVAINPGEAAATPIVIGGVSNEAKSYPGKIVFDTADHQVILIRPDGSGMQKVAGGFSPIFSPDGTQIAYLTGTPGTPADSRTIINTINLDGTNRQKLCETGGNADIKLVRWSPRNRFIALTATQQDGPGALYLCNISDRTINKGITTSQGVVAGLYDWTPDGENAVWEAGKGLDFNLYFGDPDKGGEGAVALTTGQARLVSNPNKFHYYPAARISPDGKTLAIGGSSLLFLGLPGQNGSLQTKSYKGGQVQSLAWSPDNRALVMVSLEPSAGKTIPVITIQDFSGQSGPARTLVLDRNIGTSVDWSRQ